MIAAAAGVAVVVGLGAWLAFGRDSDSGTASGPSVDITAGKAAFEGFTAGRSGTDRLEACPLQIVDRMAEVAAQDVSLAEFEGTTDEAFAVSDVQGLSGALGCERGDHSGRSGVTLGLTVFGGTNDDMVELMVTRDSDVVTRSEPVAFGGGTIRSVCLEATDERVAECVSYWESGGLIVSVDLQLPTTSQATTENVLREVLAEVVASLADLPPNA